MNGYGNSDEDHQPLTWVRGYAVYAVHVIVAAYLVSMLVTTLLMAGNFASLLTWARFTSAEVLQGQIWRIASYGLVNPPGLGFAIDMFMLAWFGRELERFFGRRTFLRFYGGLYFLSPLLFTLIGLKWPMSLAGESGAFALFIAFATLYPNVAMLFNIPTKWIATILISLYTLMALAYHDWVGLISLWATTGYACAFVGFEQGRLTLPKLNLGRRKPHLHVLPDLKPEKPVSLNKATKEDSMAEMDALLDKIARSGMSSLTRQERDQLAKAREGLMQKKTGRS